MNLAIKTWEAMTFDDRMCIVLVVFGVIYITGYWLARKIWR